MTDTAIRWRDEPARLELLDQRRLPHETVWLALDTPAEVASAIRQMVVRGAPAIGIAAAYGVALGALKGEDATQARAALAASRPTAVNLHWALARLKAMQDLGASPEALLAEAKAIHAEDFRQNRTIGELGARLLPPGATVLTHCNTGALATGGHGTALGVIRSAHDAGSLKMVFHTETRPWMQGARLTAWELKTAGIPARMLADAAGAQLMASTRVDWLIVGADRIAANGDTANKIGTYTLALCARALGTRVMVAAPTGTFDLCIATGAEIPIEERDGAELLSWQGTPVAPAGHEAWNPVFDVTPASLIDAIVCEKGVIEHPTTEAVRAVLARPRS